MDSHGPKKSHFPKKKVGKNTHFLEALHYAWEGIQYAFETERNLRIEGVLFLSVVVAAVVLQLGRLEWAILLVTAVVVFAAEFTNSLVEWVCDLYVGPHYHPKVKHIKDAAAGLVTLVIMGAVFIGMLLFIPHLWQLGRAVFQLFIN
ncbi:MAG: diacylglycerol kinase family protein [Aerococcus sp.]|nr:diacylglycerol kinase family protein [Aerococcus sp.]